MREREFEIYLGGRFQQATINNTISYCRTVQKIIGCDLESVVYEDAKFEDVRDKIKNEPSHIKNAFEYYKEFASVNPQIPQARTPRRGPDLKTNNIRYDKSVKNVEQMPGLCASLEMEYASIHAFAMQHFASIVGEFDPIDVILSDECPMEEYHIDEEYIKILEQKQERTEAEEYFLHTRVVVSPVIGCFIDGPIPYIVIYYRNFSWKNLGEYCAKVINCIAHEYMHYLQHLHYKRMGCSALHTKEERKVKEALAEFFAMLFSLNRSGNDDFEIVKERRKSWKSLLNTGWPYAYALYFNKGKGNSMSNIYFDYLFDGSVSKVISVFEICQIPLKAYELLVE